MVSKSSNKPAKPASQRVEFPPVLGERRVKLNRFLEVAGAFMDVELVVEEVTVIRVTVKDAERQDVVGLLRSVASSEKNKPPRPVAG